MPSWKESQEELERRLDPQGNRDVDGFRRDKLKKIEELTKRPLIVYATDFLNRQKVVDCRGEISIEHSDCDGLIEVTKRLESKSVDVLLQSPGGDPDAANSLVRILKNKFSDIRFIIPRTAKSAATMMALSGQKLLMDINAELGPIDPQMRIQKSDGTINYVPAQAIIDQFENAQKSLAKDQRFLTAWLPILQQYGPGLYQQCQNAIVLSKDYVRGYLKEGMFKRFRDRDVRTETLVEYLGNHNQFKTHGAYVGIMDLRDKGAVVGILNNDRKLSEAVADLMYAISFTFLFTGAFKLFENSRADCLVRSVQVIVPALRIPPGIPTQTPPVPTIIPKN